MPFHRVWLYLKLQLIFSNRFQPLCSSVDRPRTGVPHVTSVHADRHMPLMNLCEGNSMGGGETLMPYLYDGYYILNGLLARKLCIATHLTDPSGCRRLEWTGQHPSCPLVRWRDVLFIIFFLLLLPFLY